MKTRRHESEINKLRNMLKGAPPMAVHYQTIAGVNNTKQGAKHGLRSEGRKKHAST